MLSLKRTWTGWKKNSTASYKNSREVTQRKKRNSSFSREGIYNAVKSTKIHEEDKQKSRQAKKFYSIIPSNCERSELSSFFRVPSCNFVAKNKKKKTFREPSRLKLELPVKTKKS